MEESMAQRRWMGICGSMTVLWLAVCVAPAVAVPHHDMGWGKEYKFKGYKGDSYKDHDYKDDDKGYKHHEYKSYGDKDYSKDYGGKDYGGKDYGDGKGYGGKDYGKGYKDHDGHHGKKCGYGYGYGKKDPDCDPPVATPEPTTLLLLGSTLAGFGLYASRRGRGQAKSQ
jgi:hypothetical protein